MSYAEKNLSGVKKVLVVKLRQLGDVLLSGPVLSALREALPAAQIHFYVYTESIPLLEGHPDVDKVLGCDRSVRSQGWRRRLRQEWELLKQIRHEKYDLVINLTEGDRGALVAFVSGAQMRVGFEPKGRLAKGVYTHIVKQAPGLRHMVERNLDAVRRIGIFPEIGARELKLPVSFAAKEAVSKMVQGPYVMIHPTSRWRFKCWPVAKMRELVEVFLSKGEQVVLTSGPDPIEQEMVRQIGDGLNVVNLSGQISLQELAALIDQSELLVCVDSLPFHMANALKKPVVALFGPTSDVTWGIWRNPNAQIVAQKLSCRPCYQDGCGGSKRSDCLATLPLSQVVEACYTQMSSKVGFSATRKLAEFAYRK